MVKKLHCIIFDWGDTIMREFAEYNGPMYRWPRVQAVDGVAEVLPKLAKKCTLVLASNAEDSEMQDIRKALARVGLEPFFSQIYCPKSLNRRKPSPEFFRSILADLRLPASAVVMVGDNLVADVLGANSAGIYAIWFNEKTNERSKGSLHSTIHHFSELPAAIEAHEARLELAEQLGDSYSGKK